MIDIPHNREIEARLLGAFISSPEMLRKHAQEIHESLFHSPAYSRLWKGIKASHAKHGHAKLLTLSAILRESGDLDAVGGSTELTRIAVSPERDQVPSFLHILTENAKARALIRIASRIATSPDLQSLGADDLIPEIRTEIDRIESMSAKEPAFRLFNENMCDILQYFCEINEGRHEQGISTGFHEIDKMLNGMKAGQMIVLAARPSLGKAQPIDEPVLTPSGFVEIGSLKIGDMVVGSSGKPIAVTGVFQQGLRKIYKSSFSDGTWTRSCDEHLWMTTTRNERRRGCTGSVKQLSEIRGSLEREGGGPNHAIPEIGCVEFDKGGELPLNPYLLGLLIGDGKLDRGVSFFKPENDLRNKIANMIHPLDEAVFVDDMQIRIKRKTRSSEKSETAKSIKLLGLDGKRSYEKFIPKQYLTSSSSDRLQLLRGLIDTDGSVVLRGQVEYSTSSPQLAHDVIFLVRSLGGRATVTSRIPEFGYLGEKKLGRKSFRIMVIMPSRLPFSSEKHIRRWEAFGHPVKKFHKTFVRVEESGEAECVCISVDSDDHLYATRDFILTHNTALGLNMAVNIAQNGVPVGVFSLEMSTKELMARIIAAEARVSLRTADDIRKYTREIDSASMRVRGIPLLIDDTPRLTVSEIRKRAIEMQVKHGIRLLVIDYVQLIKGEGLHKNGNREQEVAGVSRGIKAMAKELGIPVLLLAQLNRAAEGKERPNLSQLRESGQLENDADVVAFIHRDRQAQQTLKEGESIQADIIIEKNRSGPCGVAHVAFFPHCCRFDNSVHSFGQGDVLQ